MSCILLTTSLNDRYFINNYTGEHYWKKSGIYDKNKCEEIYKILLPLRNSLKDNKNHHDLLVDDKYRLLL